jgi:glycosyltransferase involved in cell wall biosynthesis
VSRLVDVPYSMSVHAGADIFVEPVLLAEKIGRARRVVTCTLHNKRRLASLVGPELDRRVAVVRHGVDTATYREAPSTPRRVPGPPRVLAVGQLTPRKGMVPLLMTCRILRDRGREHRCHIVGDGPQRRELEALARALELGSSAWLRGALAPDEVVAEYRRAAMFVLPCVTAANGDVDGIPNALVEAMASQLPVVSSDLPAIRELVTDGVDGLLVPPGDVEALAAAIERLLDEPALRRELGVRARRTVVAKFDIERNIRRLTATLYPELQRQR